MTLLPLGVGEQLGEVLMQLLGYSSVVNDGE
jgi:hypothetical protein